MNRKTVTGLFCVIAVAGCFVIPWSRIGDEAGVRRTQEQLDAMSADLESSLAASPLADRVVLEWGRRDTMRVFVAWRDQTAHWHLQPSLDHWGMVLRAHLVGARRAQLVSAGPDRCYQTDDDLHSVEFTLHIDDQGEANDEQAH